MRSGEWVDPNAGRMLFSDWVEEWRTTTVHLRASTADRYERDLRLHVLPRFGTMRLADITPRDVRAWLSELTGAGAGAGPSAVNRRFRVLRMLMNAAVDNELIARAPTKGVKPPPIPKQEMRFLSAVEVRELAEAIHPWFRTWVYFAAYTGLRWSEMLGLRRKDVDLLRGHVRVEQQIIEVRSKFLGFGPVKTEAGRRTVAMPKFLVEMMEAQLAERAQLGTDGLVFVNTAGNSPHASSFNGQTWQLAKKRAGLKTCAGTTFATPPALSPSNKAPTPRRRGGGPSSASDCGPLLSGVKVVRPRALRALHLDPAVGGGRSRLQEEGSWWSTSRAR